MIKQKVEQYNLDVVDLEKELEAEFEARCSVISMISVTDRYVPCRIYDNRRDCRCGTSVRTNQVPIRKRKGSHRKEII